MLIYLQNLQLLPLISDPSCVTCVTVLWLPSLKRELTAVVYIPYCKNQKHHPVKQSTSHTTQLGMRKPIVEPRGFPDPSYQKHFLLQNNSVKQCGRLRWEGWFVKQKPQQYRKYRSYPSLIGPENPSEAGPTLFSCAPTSSPPALLAPEQQDLGGQGNRDKAAEISHVCSPGGTTGVQPQGCSSSYGEILLLLSSLRRNSPLSAVFSTSKPETGLIWP